MTECNNRKIVSAHIIFWQIGIFTDPTIKGKLGVNAMKAKKHLYGGVGKSKKNKWYYNFA